MKLEVGKLYQCKDYFLLLYPDPDTAALGHYVAVDAALADPEQIAAHWSNQLGKPVRYVDKNIPILVLNSKEKFYEVLAGDRKGWIICEDRLNIKEIP